MDVLPVCVFAKPPVPGRVKTRIGRVVGDALACELAGALLRDVVDVVRACAGTEVVIATTDATSDRFAVGDVTCWEQGDGDLGARIERILKRGIERYGMAIAIVADTVGLTADRLEAAMHALRSGRPVMGPSNDGGFYLLGVSECPVGLLEDLPWSQACTFAETRSRIGVQLGAPLLMPDGIDLDEIDDLRAFEQEVAAGHMSGGRAWGVVRRILARVDASGCHARGAPARKA
jgi:hypothetical protein